MAETKGVDKALSDVNKVPWPWEKNSEVEKLLKIDPKNTEARRAETAAPLRQVANTEGKLKTVSKKRKAQVNEAIPGEITEEQYRTFQREVAKTTRNWNDMRANSKMRPKEQGGLGQGSGTDSWIHAENGQKDEWRW